MKPWRDRRVLIVEDDSDTLDVLETLAEHEGWETRTSRSGHDALQIGVRFKPHVLITDYLLDDDLTGVDVIVGVRNRGLDPKCILITAVLSQALSESLPRIQGVIILAKPVNLHRVAQIVSTS